MAELITHYYIRLKSYDTVTPAEVTHYFSTGGKQPSEFATINVDSGSFPSANHFKRRVKQPGNYEQNMFKDGQTYGESQAGFGICQVINVDGDLDYLLSHRFDGRAIDIWRGSYDPANPDTLDVFVWFTGVMEQVEFTFSKTQPAALNIRIRDKWSNLQVPIQTTKYAGTNSGATGLEGLPDDIKGKPKPLAFGRVYNAAAVPVNTSSLTYQVHDGPIYAINAVYDKGVALTLDTAIGTSGDFSDSTGLLAATIGAGKYATCLAEGLFRLNTTPAGEVTCDLQGDNTSATYRYKIADICNYIIDTFTSLSSSDLNSSSFTGLNTDFGVEVGIYITEERDVDEVVIELLTSGGAFGVLNRVGQVVVGQLKLPSGTPVATVTARDIIEIERRALNDTDKGIPAYSVELGYKKNYTKQDAGSLAGSVTDARRAFLNLDYRTAVSTDTDVLLASPLASVIRRKSLITTESDANTEAARLLAIYGDRRDYYIVTVDSSKFDIELNDVVTLELARFGMDSGVDYRVIGLVEEAETGHLIIRLWG